MDELIRNLKQAGVLRSRHVEAAFGAIDRKDFVPPEYRDEAYGDYPLPIGRGQTISQPYTVAFMLDLLDPKPGERILDVGAGSGWQTALLAQVVSQDDQDDENGESAHGLDEIATERLYRAKRFTERSDSPASSRGRIYAVERIPELCALARDNISKYNFIKRETVELRCGDAFSGLPDEAPFDKIIAAAAGEELPAAWRAEVKSGGIIVAPIGSSIWRYTKRGPNKWDTEEFPGFAFVPLVTGGNTPQPPRHLAHEARSKPRELKTPWRTAILLAAAAAAAAFAPLRLREPVHIEIASGSGSRAIAGELKAAGLVRSKWTFLAYTALTGQAADLKPGAYEFSGWVSIPELAADIASGESNERTITIPEGWDLRDIGAYLEENDIATRQELYRITGEPAHRYGRGTRFPPEGFPAAGTAALDGKPPSAILEGYLYPDTYRVFRDAAAADIVLKMLENFERKVIPDMGPEAEQQGKSLAEILTMASLVEKEIADPADRRIVAGILWQRLAAGMALQVDATVNYITAKRQTPSAADLALDSPYNTYRYPGLPPTPIANPGRDAIQAALHPTPNDYRYYLSAPDGRTIFSRTLEEHARAKARYLR